MRYRATVTGLRAGFGEQFIVEGNDGYEAAHAAWCHYDLPPRPYVDNTDDAAVFRVYLPRQIAVAEDGGSFRILYPGCTINVHLSPP